MASTLDTIHKSVKSDLQAATAASVKLAVSDVLKGRKIDPNIITNVANKVVGNAMGGIMNMATQKVNKSIAGLIGKKFAKSGLSVVAGNLGAQLLTDIITGRKSNINYDMISKSIADGVSKELMARLPSSVTKNINVDILGARFNVGIMPYVTKAVNDTIGGVVKSSMGLLSGAEKPTIPGINSPIEIPVSKPSFDLGKIQSGIGDITSSISSKIDDIGSQLTGMLDTLGDSVNVLASGLAKFDTKAIADFDFSSMKIPVDVTRLSDAGEGLGKAIELASKELGDAKIGAGLGKTGFVELQTALALDNIKNPLIAIGGTFDGIENIIKGGVTRSGVRAITKDLTSEFNNIKNVFGAMTPKEESAQKAIDDATKEFGKAIAKDTHENAKKFTTYSEDQISKLVNIKEGFKDPNGKYPLPGYAARAETNKLATGDAGGTIVDEKNSKRMLGAQLPNGASWDQPLSPYAAKYPFNHVTESESGHIVEVDDTPGAERLHTYHKSGTFTEIDAVGNSVRVIRGSDYTIVDRNGYISINGKANVSATGSVNIFVGADANIECTGNAYVTSHNNIELSAAGRLKMSAGEGIDLRSPDIFIDSDHSLQINTGVGTRIHTKQLDMIVDSDAKIDVFHDMRTTVHNNNDTVVKGIAKTNVVGNSHFVYEASTFQTVTKEKHVSVKGDYKESTDKSHNLTAGVDILHQAAGKVNSKAGTSNHVEGGNDVNVKSGGSTNIQSGGSANVKGASIAMSSSSNISATASNNLAMSAKAMSIGAGGDKMSAGGGKISMVSSGMVAMDATGIHLNGAQSNFDTLPVTPANNAAGADSAANTSPANKAVVAEALETEYGSACYISGRKSVEETHIDDAFAKEHKVCQISNKLIDSIVAGNTTVPPEIKSDLALEHGVTPTLLDKKAIIIETAPASTKPSSEISPPTISIGNAPAPANLQLSDFFTVASLSTETMNPYTLQAVSVMTNERILANMQYCALNVLEPIYAVYPDMVVFQGITEFDGYNLRRSDVGLSVILDFVNATGFDGYFDIAKRIRDYIPFDNITLMYLSADISGSNADHGLIVIDYPGMYYPIPDSETPSQTLAVDKMVEVRNARNEFTYYNGILVDKSITRVT